MASRINTITNLYLIRHGQSIYNLENRFTGWKDVDLTKKGIDEANVAGNILKDIKFDFAFTSKLKRAINTLEVILKCNSYGFIYQKNIALNERDYGDLVGQNKKEASEEFGYDQVQQWRRSYDIPPPNGESLELTYNRTVPYFKNFIEQHIHYKNNNIIISAHGNSLRAIIMYLFNYSKKDILKTEIGWCEPWVISFKENQIIDFKIIERPNSASMSSFPKHPIHEKDLL